jgi:DNA-binding protein HU-beta
MRSADLGSRKGKSVNKSQLIETLSHRFEGNRAEARRALESVVHTITAEVARGEKVAITGFGAFEKVIRPARTVRNPRTGEKTRAKRTAVPKFRAGADLKAYVSGEKKMPKVTTAKKAAAKTTTARTTTSASAPTKRATANKSTSSRTTGTAAKKSTAATKTTTSGTAKKSASRSTTSPAKKTTAKTSAPRSTTSAAKKSTSSTAKKTATKRTGTASAAKKTTAKRAAKKS